MLKGSPLHESCLRKLLNIMRQDTIPDTTVLKKTKMATFALLRQAYLVDWSDGRLPINVYGKFENGKRSEGQQKKKLQRRPSKFL